MIEDPIVAEIRHFRSEHAARYGNDLKKICAALKEREKKSKKQFINFGPKPLRATKDGS